jgi:hypothetical protein
MKIIILSIISFFFVSCSPKAAETKSEPPARKPIAWIPVYAEDIEAFQAKNKSSDNSWTDVASNAQIRLESHIQDGLLQAQNGLTQAKSWLRQFSEEYLGE